MDCTSRFRMNSDTSLYRFPEAKRRRSNTNDVIFKALKAIFSIDFEKIWFSLETKRKCKTLCHIPP